MTRAVLVARAPVAAPPRASPPPRMTDCTGRLAGFAQAMSVDGRFSRRSILAGVKSVRVSLRARGQAGESTQTAPFMGADCSPKLIRFLRSRGFMFLQRSPPQP